MVTVRKIWNILRINLLIFVKFTSWFLHGRNAYSSYWDEFEFPALDYSEWPNLVIDAYAHFWRMSGERCTDKSSEICQIAIYAIAYTLLVYLSCHYGTIHDDVNTSVIREMISVLALNKDDGSIWRSQQFLACASFDIWKNLLTHVKYLVFLFCLSIKSINWITINILKKPNIINLLDPRIMTMIKLKLVFWNAPKNSKQTGIF